MISINYQKLTADMLTSRNGRHCHKGETETTAVLPCTAQPRGGPWQEFWFLGPTPEQRSPSKGVAQDSPCEHTPHIIILRADFENDFSPDILTSPRYHCPSQYRTFVLCPLPGMPSHLLCLQNSHVFKGDIVSIVLGPHLCHCIQLSFILRWLTHSWAILRFDHPWCICTCLPVDKDCVLLIFHFPMTNLEPRTNQTS